MQDLVDDWVEEITVMRNQHQGARIAFQPAFQPDHRIQIQVVGGFVQQQQIGTANQSLCQVKAHAPSAREGAHRALQLFIGKT
ncbi:hypothetical protein D3C76_1451500 [compost metagenome]